MRSNARLLLSAQVVARTADSTTLELRSYTGFADGQPSAAPAWRYDLDRQFSNPIGMAKAAAYIAERYLSDHPEVLARVGHVGVTAAILHALKLR